jgi:hypothetical protein
MRLHSAIDYALARHAEGSRGDRRRVPGAEDDHVVSRFHFKQGINVQPAYAESFGVASAHLARRRSPRRPKAERPTPNSEKAFVIPISPLPLIEKNAENRKFFSTSVCKPRSPK